MTSSAPQPWGGLVGVGGGGGSKNRKHSYKSSVRGLGKAGNTLWRDGPYMGGWVGRAGGGPYTGGGFRPYMGGQTFLRSSYGWSDGVGWVGGVGGPDLI